MNAFFNEDHEALRQLARDFAERELEPIAHEIDEEEYFPVEVFNEMAEMGFFGLKIPEEYGGSGLDARAYVCVMEELSKKCVSAAVLVSAANTLGCEPLLLAGTEEQKNKYLPQVASGEAFIAFGLTEPNAGSDAGSMTTSAEEDGDDYIINGRKCFITGAPFAKYCMVFAKTDPEKGAKGISCFFVDMSLPGVSIGKNEDKMGQRAIATSDVILEDVRVPKSEMLGEVNLGFITAMKTLSMGRIGVGCQSIGLAQGAMDLAVKHIKERKQFGRRLCDFQAIQFEMAKLETKLNAARLLVYNAAFEKDMGNDVTKAAAMAKFFASETCLEVVSGCLQMFGGYGYSKEYPIERLYRDARVLTIYEGTSQIQQIVIAGQMLK